MILGLDLATSTGFAHGGGETLPVVGALRLPSTGDDVGAFLAAFRDWLSPLVVRLESIAAAEGRDLVVIFEAPILPKPRWDPVKRKWAESTNLMTTRKLQSLAGVVELVCHDMVEAGRGVVCREAHLQTVKKELTGHGRAEKGDMVLAARRAGIDLSPGDEGQDEADAFGVWLLGIRYHAPEYQATWDRRVHGGGDRLV